MNLSPTHRSGRLGWSAGVLLAALGLAPGLSLGLATLSAQTLARTPPAPTAAGRVVPELFAGEIDDVGPQYLLLAAARPARFDVWADVDLAASSNPTLERAHPQASTVLSAQGGANWHPFATSFRGGRLAFEGGARAQTYRYGLLADDDKVVNFVQIDRNNFDLLGAHAQASWRREGWLFATALRGASLRNRRTHRVFYDEASLDWQGFRQWQLRPGTALVAGLDGARRWSRTESFGILPRAWNDRVEQAVSLVLDQALGATAWRLQPAVRAQFTHYTYAARRRDDWHGAARLALLRPLGAHAELRFTIGYDRRNSSEPIITDYEKWDGGIGSTLRWTF